MRRFFTYILLLALTLQSFYRSVMTLDYELHLPDYIAQCINKSKPLLHCNGQCVLMKKVREEEKKESRKNLIVFEYSALYLHKEHVVYKPQQELQEIIQQDIPFYLNTYSFQYLQAVFHPPLA